MTTNAGHLERAELLAYWLGEVDSATCDAVDEHLMSCDACGRQLDELMVLGEGVREAFLAGHVPVALSRSFVQRMISQGLRVREYTLSPNGSVNCTAGPDDDLLVSYLHAPLQGVQRLDALIESSLEPGVQHRLESLPFDLERGEAMFVPKLADAKRAPGNTLRVTLLSVEAEGTRELGRYVYHHEPWVAE